MSRVYYFIRAEPWDHRVPPVLRAQLFEALSHRFDPELRDEWDSIHITSIPSERASAAVHALMCARLRMILDAAAPAWSSHFRILPYEDAWVEKTPLRRKPLIAAMLGVAAIVLATVRQARKAR